METLKIGLISPPLLLTPPKQYGGLERVVADLGNALVERGHEVTLMAPPGSSIVGGKVFETIEAPERTDVDWAHLEFNAFQKYQDALKDFDVIHDHSWFGFSYLSRHGNKDLKICHTHHGGLSWDAKKVPDFIKPVNLIAISQFMAGIYAKQGWTVKYCYNGIDLDNYPFYSHKTNRFVFVGRITKFKGVDLAIRAAAAARCPIDIIGGSFVDSQEYLADIKKTCEKSGGMATLHLDLPHAEKVAIVQKAKACLIPSKMGEPFGLTCIEALSMGTPVVALDDGALREIMVGGLDPYEGRKIGNVCKGDDQFIGAVMNFDARTQADPNVCRQRAEMFSKEKMADRYVELYKEAMTGPGW